MRLCCAVRCCDSCNTCSIANTSTSTRASPREGTPQHAALSSQWLLAPAPRPVPSRKRQSYWEVILSIRFSTNREVAFRRRVIQERQERGVTDLHPDELLECGSACQLPKLGGRLKGVRESRSEVTFPPLGLATWTWSTRDGT